MRKSCQVLTLLFSLLSAQLMADDLLMTDKRLKAGDVVELVGELDLSSVPHRFVINKSTDNEESVFITNLTWQDEILFKGLRVRISGTIEDDFQQYYLKVKKIERE